MYAITLSRKLVKPYTDVWLSIFLGEVQLFMLMFPYSDFFTALPQYSALGPVFTIVSSMVTLMSIFYLLHSRNIILDVRDHYWLLILMGFFLVSMTWVDADMWSESTFFMSRTTFTLVQTLTIVLVLEERGKGVFLDTLKKIAILLMIMSLAFMILYPDESNWSVKEPVRDESFFASPNNLGQFLAISFIMINFYKRKEYNIFIVILLNVFMVYQALRCNSMTSQVGVMLCFAAYHFKRILRPLYYVIIALGIGLPIFTHLNSDPNAEKVKYANRDLTFTGRSDVWDVLLNDINTNHKEIFGFGGGGYWGNEPGDLQATPKSTIGELEWARQGHNGYLDIRVIGGFVGLTLMVIFLIHFISILFRKEKEENIESVLLFIPFIVMINNMTESSLFRNKHFYFVMFMLVYWYVNLKREEALSYESNSTLNQEQV